MLTVSYLIFTMLSFFSIYGWGYFYTSNSSKLINFLFGIITLSIIGFILHIFNINSPWINLFIIIVGIILFFLKLKIKEFFVPIVIITILFIGIIISKPHEDWGYHFNFIEYVSLWKPIIGIANIDLHYANASFISYAQKIFFLPIVNFKLINIPTFLIYNFIIYYLIKNIFSEQKFNFFIFTIFFILIIKFTRFSEFGYDFISNLILLSIFLIYYNRKGNDSDILTILIFYIFAISIKITALFFFPIILFIIFKNFSYKNFTIKKNYNRLFLLIFFTFIFILDNLIRSGCLLIFLKNTCINNNIINWTIDINKYDNFSEKIILWAKSFYHQKDILINKETFLIDFNWVANWINVHFFYKVFEFIIVCSIVPIILSIYNFKKINFTKIENFQNKIMLILTIIISISLWFILLPQLRFATASIIILFAMITEFVNYEKTQLKKISKVILISIPLIFYFSKNLIRINNEFERSDAFKFLNYPFLPEDQIPFKKNYSGIKHKNLNFYERHNYIIIKKIN